MTAIENRLPKVSSICPATGLPVRSDEAWCLGDPDGGYRLKISLVGDRIVWLQPHGYVRLENVRRGTALLDKVLRAVMPDGAPFIAVDDYRAVTGASLDARRFVFQTLRDEQRLRAYIVYGASRSFRMGLRLAARLGVFPFEVLLAGDYAQAAAAAEERAFGTEDPVDGLPHPRGGIRPLADAGGPRPANDTRTLEDYADELLAFVGDINLEPYGHAPTFEIVPRHHPFRPVYDALAVLRDDLQAVLRRHRRTRQSLERRQTELAEKQAMLHETHTTLNILLAARETSRRRLERRIAHRFRALLEPLDDGLASNSHTVEERERSAFLAHVIRHIAAPMPWEDGRRPTTPFTPRERLVACLLSTGRDVPTIARMLRLSRRTVENHCRRMRLKLGLAGRRSRLKERLVRRPAADRIPPKGLHEKH